MFILSKPSKCNKFDSFEEILLLIKERDKKLDDNRIKQIHLNMVGKNVSIKMLYSAIVKL